jgi:hypothetical protein
MLVKLQEREAEHSLPAAAETVNPWSFTPTPSGTVPNHAKDYTLNYMTIKL